MKVLRIMRNLVLTLLALGLCAVAALAVLGWQAYTRALEAAPLDQVVQKVRAQEASPPLRICPKPTWTPLSPQRTTAFTSIMAWTRRP